MLHVLSQLLGPVFAKEMLEMARRKRYYLNRVLYALVLLFSLFVVWEEYSWQLQSRGRTSIRVMANMARSQFTAISVVQYIAVYVLVPLFLCGVIASEREEHTLELMFTTDLKNREIVLGKLFSRTVVLVLLILTALPILSLIQFSGGIDPDSLWRTVAVTLFAIIYTGGTAIYFSAVTRSPIGALVRTYWWIAVWIFGLPITVTLPVAAMYRSGRTGPFFSWVMAGLFLVDPIWAFMAALDTFTYNFMRSLFGSSELAEWFFPLAFVLPALWSAFLIWRAIRRLRLDPRPFVFIPGKIPPIRNLRQWLRQRATSQGQRRSRICFGLIEIFNPLWLRARRTRVYDREGHVGKIQWGGWLAAAFFLSLFGVCEPQAFDSWLASLFMAPIWIGVAALAAILASTSLVGDRRRGFLDLVLMTPLRPREILDGTFLAVWQHWRRVYWLVWGVGLIFCFTPRTYLIGFLASTVTGTLFCLLLVMHGVVCSLSARTFAAAVVACFVLPLTVIVGMLFLMPAFRMDAGPVFWILTVLSVPATWFWAHKRATPAAVASFSLAVHLFVAGAATAWTWGGWHHGNMTEYPIAGMHPGFLTLIPLDGQPGQWGRDSVDKTKLLPCYWAALLVNVFWLRWWALRNFERLTERARPGTRQITTHTQQALTVHAKVTSWQDDWVTR